VADQATHDGLSRDELEKALGVTDKPQAERKLTGDEHARRPLCVMEVGDSWRSRGRTITEADVVNFAGVTMDFHPQHTDAVYAEESEFGARVAHGMLILSFAIGLVPSDYAVAMRRIKNVVFKKPVYLGDTIYVEGEVAGITPLSDEVGLVSGRWKVVNQHGETVAKLEPEAIWLRDWK
jgi:3-hydroxybutyryl-CoA dehydratase